MPTLDDQLRSMSCQEQRRANAPHERAALLATEHRLGMVRLTDALLVDEDPLTCAELAQRFPELRLQARGTTLPPRYRLALMTDERARTLLAEAPWTSEGDAVQRAIKRALRDAETVDLRLSGEDGAPPPPRKQAALQLTDEEQAAVERVKRLAGISGDGAA